MTADPRVEAVAEALARTYGGPYTAAADALRKDPGHECSGRAETALRAAWPKAAAIAVAALDAYDRKHPIFADATHYAAVETDLRERIAQEIEAAHRTAPDRAVIAEAAIARVRALCDDMDSRELDPWYWQDATDEIRAALDGEA